MRIELQWENKRIFFDVEFYPSSLVMLAKGMNWVCDRDRKALEDRFGWIPRENEKILLALARYPAENLARELER